MPISIQMRNYAAALKLTPDNSWKHWQHACWDAPVLESGSMQQMLTGARLLRIQCRAQQTRILLLPSRRCTQILVIPAQEEHLPVPSNSLVAVTRRCKPPCYSDARSVFDTKNPSLPTLPSSTRDGGSLETWSVWISSLFPIEMELQGVS